MWRACTARRSEGSESERRASGSAKNRRADQINKTWKSNQQEEEGRRKRRQQQASAGSIDLFLEVCEMRGDRYGLKGSNWHHKQHSRKTFVPSARSPYFFSPKLLCLLCFFLGFAVLYKLSAGKYVLSGALWSGCLFGKWMEVLHFPRF